MRSFANLVVLATAVLASLTVAAPIPPPALPGKGPAVQLPDSHPKVETPTVNVPPTPGTPSPPNLPPVPAVNAPVVPPVGKPDLPPVNKPDVPPVNKPEVPEVGKPEVPPVNKPEVPAVGKPEVPEVHKPEAPPVNKPAIPAVNTPSIAAPTLPQIITDLQSQVSAIKSDLDGVAAEDSATAMAAAMPALDALKAALTRATADAESVSKDSIDQMLEEARGVTAIIDLSKLVRQVLVLVVELLALVLKCVGLVNGQYVLPLIKDVGICLSGLLTILVTRVDGLRVHLVPLVQGLVPALRALGLIDIVKNFQIA